MQNLVVFITAAKQQSTYTHRVYFLLIIFSPRIISLLHFNVFWCFPSFFFLILSHSALQKIALRSLPVKASRLPRRPWWRCDSLIVHAAYSLQGLAGLAGLKPSLDSNAHPVGLPVIATKRKQHLGWCGRLVTTVQSKEDRPATPGTRVVRGHSGLSRTLQTATPGSGAQKLLVEPNGGGGGRGTGREASAPRPFAPGWSSHTLGQNSPESTQNGRCHLPPRTWFPAKCRPHVGRREGCIRAGPSAQAQRLATPSTRGPRPLLSSRRSAGVLPTVRYWRKRGSRTERREHKNAALSTFPRYSLNCAGNSTIWSNSAWWAKYLRESSAILHTSNFHQWFPENEYGALLLQFAVILYPCHYFCSSTFKAINLARISLRYFSYSIQSYIDDATFWCWVRNALDADGTGR